MAEFFSKIFVDTERSQAELLSILASSMSGYFDGFTIIAADCEIYVDTNDEYTAEILREDPQEFLYFPYIVEVYADDAKTSLETYLAQVATIMRMLADNGMRLVVACDWEDVLPGKGKLGF